MQSRFVTAILADVVCKWPEGCYFTHTTYRLASFVDIKGPTSIEDTRVFQLLGITGKKHEYISIGFSTVTYRDVGTNEVHQLQVSSLTALFVYDFDLALVNCKRLNIKYLPYVKN